MEVAKVTNEDALRAGQIATFLKEGKWQMDGAQAAVYALAVRWFHTVCQEMVKQLPKPATTSAPTTPSQAAPVTAPKPSLVGPNVRGLQPSKPGKKK
jgi:hypothetical protein